MVRYVNIPPNSEFMYWESRVADGLAAGLPYVSREMCSVDPIGTIAVPVPLSRCTYLVTEVSAGQLNE